MGENEGKSQVQPVTGAAAGQVAQAWALGQAVTEPQLAEWERQKWPSAPPRPGLPALALVSRAATGHPSSLQVAAPPLQQMSSDAVPTTSGEIELQQMPDAQDEADQSSRGASRHGSSAALMQGRLNEGGFPGELFAATWAQPQQLCWCEWGSAVLHVAGCGVVLSQQPSHRFYMDTQQALNCLE